MEMTLSQVRIAVMAIMYHDCSWIREALKNERLEDILKAYEALVTDPSIIKEATTVASPERQSLNRLMEAQLVLLSRRGGRIF